MKQLAIVGGKNASLGEMFRELVPMGILVPDGYATTAAAYWAFLDQNNIKSELASVLKGLDTHNFSNLSEVGQKARLLLKSSVFPF